MYRKMYWLGLCVTLGCSHGIELGSDLSIVKADAGAGSAGASGLDASTAVCEVARCENKIYACGDCVDNDNDQRVDSLDPECLGPCDDSEESYLGSVLGQSDATCKVDCYFDADNGSGNDDCHWSHRCDPLSLAPAFFPSGDAQCAYDLTAPVPGSSLTCDQLRVAQSAACLATCLPLTPAGCDCFGCCEWPIGSGRSIWLGSKVNGLGSCDAVSLDDATKCYPCTRVSACSR